MSFSDPDDAWKAFYNQFGPTMFAWQLIESELATLFSKLTNIPPDMAVQIFYSATNFNSRIDIFSASLTASKTPQSALDLADDIIARSKGYSAFRNKCAHDQPLLKQSGGKFEVILVHGKGQFQSDAVKKQYTDAAITTQELEEAVTIFTAFAALIRDFWVQHPMRPASLETLRTRLAQLPVLPRPKDQSRPPAKPKRQRPPSRE